MDKLLSNPLITVPNPNRNKRESVQAQSIYIMPQITINVFKQQNNEGKTRSNQKPVVNNEDMYNLVDDQQHTLEDLAQGVDTVANETDAEEYLESSNIQNLIKEIKLQEEISRKKRLENQKQKNKKRIIMQKTVPNAVQKMAYLNEETDLKIE